MKIKTRKLRKTKKSKPQKLRTQRKVKLENDIPIKIKEEILSETDKLVFVYKRKTPQSEILEVTNVSYEIFVKGKWYTVKRYDDAHGFLHRHTIASIQNPTDIVEPSRDGVIKKGNHKTWLAWAIKDIRVHYWLYRRAFLKRSGIKDS